VTEGGTFKKVINKKRDDLGVKNGNPQWERNPLEKPDRLDQIEAKLGEMEKVDREPRMLIPRRSEKEVNQEKVVS